jgi:hypothetical protein
LLALQAAQRPKLVALDGMNARRPSFAPADMQTPGAKLHLVPLQIADLGSSQTMPVSDQDMVASRCPYQADEVIEAIAKTMAELTSRQDGIFRQHLVERLMQEIMKFDDEFRREDAVGTIGSHARHCAARARTRKVTFAQRAGCQETRGVAARKHSLYPFAIDILPA